MGTKRTLRTMIISIRFVGYRTEMVRLKLPSDITDERIRKELTEASRNLYEDDSYGREGRSAETLFRHICKHNPSWCYEVLTPELEWTDWEE